MAQYKLKSEIELLPALSGSNSTLGKKNVGKFVFFVFSSSSFSFSCYDDE